MYRIGRRRIASRIYSLLHSAKEDFIAPSDQSYYNTQKAEEHRKKQKYAILAKYGKSQSVLAVSGGKRPVERVT
jgi:hypothetical protein